MLLSHLFVKHNNIFEHVPELLASFLKDMIEVCMDTRVRCETKFLRLQAVVRYVRNIIKLTYPWCLA
jgi:hypothetical protein